MYHQLISRTVAMNGMKHVVKLSVFGWAVVKLTFAVLIMGMVAATAFQAAVNPLLVHFVYELNLLLIIEVVNRSGFRLAFIFFELYADSF